MASAGDEESDSVLSDVEGDEAVPIVLKDPSQEDISFERFREVLAELEREKQARLVAENSKSELQVSFNRLKVLAHEAIKKRDECARQRDKALRENEEALKLNEKISAELAEALRLKDEILKQKDESDRSSRSEIDVAAQLLVTGIDKISGKVNNFKNFSEGGLPRSQKYSGLPLIAYGAIKRTNEIVEELLKQIDIATKSRNDAREQMDQRNYEIAIEVSELEATISRLRDAVAEKDSEVERLEKSVTDKEERISEMDSEMLKKLNLAEKESGELKQLVDEYDSKLKILESKINSQRPLLMEQLNYVSKIHDQIYDVIKIVDANQSDLSELSDSLFLPGEMDIVENLRASLAGMESIYELAKITMDKVRDSMEERSRKARVLNETVALLTKEKHHIGSLLRSALSRKMTLDPSFKISEISHVTERGLGDAGKDFRVSNAFRNENVSHGKQGTDEMEEDEVYTLAGALENIVRESQLEIIELQHAVEELRAESSLLKVHVEAQAKELSQRKHRIEELEEKERIANESVEGLMMDIAASEEEIVRWKVAAEQEAAAGKAVEHEFVAQLSAIRQELDEAKQAMLESEKKLKFKEETAAAAMAARDAAEKSLRLADLRASRLRERVEDLSRQLEVFDTREASRSLNRQRYYICWPWQWLGLNFVGFHQAETQQQQSSNEMELSEPLL